MWRNWKVFLRANMHKFKVGDKVEFLGQKMVISELVLWIFWKDEQCPEVKCSWLDSKNNLVNGFFSENMLVAVSGTKELKKYDLLYCKQINCFGFKNYGSIIANNFHSQNLNADTEIAKETRFVYDFKKYGHHWEVLGNYFLLLKSYFNTQTVIAIPSHTTEINQLQKMFGTVIKRIAVCEERKYNHKIAISDSYKMTYSIDFEAITTKKVILVDDVVTSGETMGHFANVLESKGFEVVKFALGIKDKLQPVVVNSFYGF